MAVRRADLNQRDINTDAAGANQAGYVGEEHRHEVGTPFLHCSPHVGSNEKSDVTKSVLELGRHVGSRAKGHEMNDLVVGEVGPVGNHGFHQRDGFSRSGTNENPATGRNASHCLSGGDDLTGEALPQVDYRFIIPRNVVHRATSTGFPQMWTRRSDTLPSNSRATAPRPRLPTSTSSMSGASAKRAISSAGAPRRMSLSAFMPANCSALSRNSIASCSCARS